MRTLTLLALSACVCAADNLPFWTPPAGPVALDTEGRAALDQARAARNRLIAIQGPRTVQNTLAPYDEIMRYIGLAQNPAGVMRDSSPDAAIREAAVKLVQQGSAFRSEVMLDPRVYKALAALEGSEGLNAEDAFYLSKTLKTFRTMGVNQSDDTRAKIAATRDEIVKLEQAFNRNIIDGLAHISFRAADLDGVPADYLRAHKADGDGNIMVSNDREDIEPILFYVRNPQARRRAQVFFANRGYPANMEALAKLIEARHRLALLCGFPDYAEMAMQDRMAASGAGQREFLKQADLASKDAAEAQKKLLVEAKLRDFPSSSPEAALDYSDLQYYIRVIREQRYHFNEQDARPYFPYALVKESVLAASSKMFGIAFRPVTTVVWHPSVEAYDVLEKGAAGKEEVVGRIYLDMFPRPGKYQHFATYRIRAGVAGKQLPEGTLICNFTAPNGDDPGLMTPSMAQTFFHEFGHLLHGIFSGRQKWADLNRPETDFIEAPSQLRRSGTRTPKSCAASRAITRRTSRSRPIWSSAWSAPSTLEKPC